ncbi:hypothetical protein [Ilumatobacter sp.]|uniref:hypothetical protein n=1 Tax=Ilumatobacter sp. TaxID=1967498 RepID=UPI003C333655
MNTTFTPESPTEPPTESATESPTVSSISTVSTAGAPTSATEMPLACTRAHNPFVETTPNIGQAWSRDRVLEQPTKPPDRVTPARQVGRRPSAFRRIGFAAIELVRMSTSPSDRALAPIDGAHRSPRG